VGLFAFSGGQISNPEEVPSARSGYIPGLDGLRGVAIIWVILFHALVASPDVASADYSLARRIAASGWLGVDLFFVLSGFLITGILFDAKNSANRARNFYARRILRIFPLYYLVLIILSFGIIVARRPEWPNWIYLSNIGGIHGIPHGMPYQHLWSLAVEEQYYLVWPWLIFLLPRVWAMRSCVALLVISVVGRGILSSIGGMSRGYMLTPFHMDGLVIGSWIALAARSNPEILRKIARWTPIPLLVLTLGLVAVRQGLPIFDRYAITLGILFVSALTGSVLCWILVNGAPRFLERNPLNSIGRYSYAMYLFHWPLLVAMYDRKMFERMGEFRTTGAGIFSVAIATIVVAYLLAWISWHAFERHFLDLKRYFRSEPIAGGSAAGV